jgi:hypothetical protein
LALEKGNNLRTFAKVESARDSDAVQETCKLEEISFSE